MGPVYQQMGNNQGATLNKLGVDDGYIFFETNQAGELPIILIKKKTRDWANNDLRKGSQ
jgi:hypothetical protein